jgi:hypothetical protein
MHKAQCLIIDLTKFVILGTYFPKPPFKVQKSLSPRQTLNRGFTVNEVICTALPEEIYISFEEAHVILCLQSFILAVKINAVSQEIM